MAYQETTTNSYGSRLGSSFKGIGSGIILIIIGTILLWWNEGRAVKTDKMLDEAQEKAICIDNVDVVDPDYDGKLIHATGMTATADSLSDPLFDIGAVAVRLDRKVEYYQWVEEVSESKKDKLGGSEEVTKTYTYKQKWVNSPVKSSEFKDSTYRNANKVLANLKNESIVAENVTFGAYRLPDFLISSMRSAKPLDVNLPEAQIKQLNERIIPAATGKSVEMYKLRRLAEMKDIENALIKEARQVLDSIAADSIAKSYKRQPSELDAEYEFVHQSGNTLYLGRSEAAPEIGDVRITFTYVLPGTASIIAKVKGDTFVNYVAKNGKKFAVLSSGEKSLDEMMETERAGNSLWRWALRIVGILLVIGGFKGLFAPIPTLLKVVPFLSNIIGAGVNLVASLIGFVWSLVVIAIAWLFYRPLVSIILLIVVIGCIVLTVKIVKGKNTMKGQESASKPEKPNAD